MLERSNKVSSVDLQAVLVDDAATENLRRRCRQCRAKLAAPTDNSCEAFCSRGCHAQFFRTRCRVCEGAIEQPARGARLICNKAKCKNAWRAGFGFGRYHHPISAESIQEVPVNKGPKPAISGNRASWRVVAAGVPISANQYHCAIVGADGLVGTGGHFTKPDWQEVTSPDGVRCWVTRWRAAR